MAMLRALLLASATMVAVTGLSVQPHIEEQAELDPELINTAGEKFHITKPGYYLMIELPEVPVTSTSGLVGPRLHVNASFVKPVDDVYRSPGKEHCSDIVIDKITLQGYILGTNVTTMTLSVASDVFNETSALGLEFTNTRSNGATMTYPNVLVPEVNTTVWGNYIPWCPIKRPRGFIRVPGPHSYRQRTRIFTMECSFQEMVDGELQSNIVQIHWSTVWRGISKTTGENVYINDLSLSVSDVGTSPAGLLGTDPHEEETEAIAGCEKAQPWGSPAHYQTRRQKKQPKWQQRRHYYSQ